MTDEQRAAILLNAGAVFLEHRRSWLPWSNRVTVSAYFMQRLRESLVAAGFDVKRSEDDLRDWSAK